MEPTFNFERGAWLARRERKGQIMSVHRYHPDPKRGEVGDRLLYEDCAECAFKARTLVGLDLPSLRTLLDVTIQGYWPYTPNVTEQEAESNFWHALLVMERLAGKPWQELLGVSV